MNSSTPPPVQVQFSFENSPITVRSYFACKHRANECPKWFLSITDRTGAVGILHIENAPYHLSAHTETFDGNFIHKECLISHWFEATEHAYVRHCVSIKAMNAMRHRSRPPTKSMAATMWPALFASRRCCARRVPMMSPHFVMP